MVLTQLLESEMPRYIAIGENILEHIRYPLKQIKKHTTGVVLIDSEDEITEKIHTIFRNEKVHAVVYELQSLNRISELKKISEQIILENHDLGFFLTYGNEHTIEKSKYIVMNTQQNIHRHIPYINVPSTTGHDGLSSPFILIEEEHGGEFLAGKTNPPFAIIADVNLITQDDDWFRYLIAGVGDTIAKITAIWDWQFAFRMRSEPYSDFATATLTQAQKLLENRIQEVKHDPIKLIKDVLKALIGSGLLMALADNIRIGFGSEHLVAMSLDKIKPGVALHGERCALSTILMAYLQGQDWRRIKKLVKKIGLPATVEELGYTFDEAVHALQQAHTMYNIYTILGENGLNYEAACNLLKQTGTTTKFGD